MKVVPYSYKQRCKFSSRPAACKLTDRLATLDADCCGGNSLAASAASASAAASSSSSESSCSAAAASAAAGELTAVADGLGGGAAGCSEAVRAWLSVVV